MIKIKNPVEEGGIDINWLANKDEECPFDTNFNCKIGKQTKMLFLPPTPPELDYEKVRELISLK